MMLSSLDQFELDCALQALDQALVAHPSAHLVFRRISETKDLASGLQTDLYASHGDAVRLGVRLGIPLSDSSPSEGFSWNGAAVASQTETAVLLHEFAHWQIAPPARRVLPDFGLGAGPETGRKKEANEACCVDDATKEREEDLASLLGILWDVELGGPAIIAFCEQNWLELYDRPGTSQHFVSVLGELVDLGLVDEMGCPCVAYTSKG
ncbi:MAG: hypothetical protein GKS03_00645 [Alphaproteobacteria bacterium]|nr:hypothetical protein [Alphaproteobacteria bacterium]